MILVISYPGEEHTDRVVAHLAEAGREVARIGLGEFPAQRQVDFHWPASGPPAWRIAHEGGWIDLSRARAVWWRRVTDFALDPALGRGEGSAFAHSETSQALHGVLDSLDCPWMNPRAADAAAHHKPYQWTIARQLGLKLPRTRVTTSPQAARDFIDSLHPSRVVFKAFLAAAHQWRETRLVEAQDLERLDLVRYAPVIFQEYVTGVDLRITLVGHDIYAAEIDARHTSYAVDMRMVIGEARLRAVTLPDGLQTRLRALQDRLGLVYGAVDMRRTQEGEYVFLEVNPAGQWLFVEERCGLPISQAVAGYLARAADAGQPTPHARHESPLARHPQDPHAIDATHPG